MKIIVLIKANKLNSYFAKCETNRKVCKFLTQIILDFLKYNLKKCMCNHLNAMLIFLYTVLGFRKVHWSRKEMLDVWYDHLWNCPKKIYFSLIYIFRSVISFKYNFLTLNVCPSGKKLSWKWFLFPPLKWLISLINPVLL